MKSPGTTTRLVLVGVVLLVVAGYVPWIALSVLGWPNLAGAAILPAISITVACVTGAGWRAGAIAVVPFALLAGLATWASPNPLWAAIVLAAAAFLRGFTARLGLHDSLTLLVITLGFLVTMPPHFDSSVPAAWLVALVTFVAGAWAAMTIFIVHKRLPTLKLAHLENARVLGYSIVLALMVGSATFIVDHFHLGQTGGWIILTILVVFQPYLGNGFKKAGNRALGTVAGFGIALVVGVFFPTGPILYVIGSAFMVVAFLFILQHRPYWLYAMVLTPAVVLVTSATSTVGVIAVERLEATVIGIAFTLLVMLVLFPLYNHLQNRPTRSASA